MNHLPPQAFEQLATRADIDRLDGRFDRLEDRFDQLTVEVREMRGVMRDQFRTYTITTVGSLTALTGIFAAIVAIIR